MNIIYIIPLSVIYILYSLFITSLYIRKEGNNFTQKIKKITVDYNERLYQRYKESMMTQRMYIKNKRDVGRELRAAKRFNMIVSPFLAIPITLDLLIKYFRG